MSEEKRRAFRYPVLGDRRSVTLKADGAQWPASLLDESAGGFRVVVTGRFPLQEGQSLELESDAGRCRVRIVRQTSRPGRTEVGLERLEDLFDPTEVPGAGRSWLGASGGRHRRPLGGASLAVPALIVAMITAVSFWLASPQWRSALWAGGAAEPPAQAQDGAGGTPRPAPGPPSPPGERRERSIWGLRPSRTRPPSQEDRGAGQSRAELKATVDQQFSRFLSLASQAAVQELGLSADQQEQIRGIREACARRLSDAYQRRSPRDSQWLRDSEEILQEGIRQAGEVLTVEQQAQWKAMTSRP